ncbi:hypothetical protein WJX84_003714 [Apatococcus fuscideae]|uniref:Xrn1 N-terminal domain-containing protein n=1 Tax=Apatococcus fuscideae TaxID=2026836 RepID=A0AAW1SLD3_9CHLO
MGVAGFGAWFSKEYKGAYVSAQPRKVDHVYVDTAGFLHNAYRQASKGSVARFYVRLFGLLDRLFLVCIPTKSIMIALDGPAPLAKLLTQRARRRHQVRKDQPAVAPGTIDRIAFTPGAPLMLRVQDALQYYICQRMQDNPSWRSLQVELSGATVKGEGETKMLQRLLGNDADMSGSHMLASSDSDMLLMALMSTAATSDIFVLSDRTVPSQGTPSPRRCFSLRALEQLWLKQHGHLKHPDQTDAQHLRGLKADLCLLAIAIRGNDYMPGTRSPFTLTMQGAWHKYLALRSTAKWRGRTIIQTDKDNQIDMAALGAMLRSLGNISMERSYDDSFQLLPDACAEEYLQGLQWVVDMYSKGIMRMHIGSARAWT